MRYESLLLVGQYGRQEGRQFMRESFRARIKFCQGPLVRNRSHCLADSQIPMASLTIKRLKVTEFLSFQRIQATSRNIESKNDCAVGSSRLRWRNHQGPRPSSPSGANAAKPKGDSSMNQACLARTHPRTRCPSVSVACPQAS